MSQEKLERLKNRLVRGISNTMWMEIKIQSIKEGCRTIGGYIEKVHLEHIDTKK